MNTNFEYKTKNNEIIITKYVGIETSVSIPNEIDEKKVTSIGKFAFCNCSSLMNVTIPTSVTSIGKFAFSYCTSLTSVAIPDSVVIISDYTFANCTNLTNVTIPSGVASIGDHAFYDCSSLASITIPSSVDSIGNHAFEYCTSLTSITIPSSVTSIGGAAFAFCKSLTSVTIPPSVTHIGKYAFYGCELIKGKVIEQQPEANQSVKRMLTSQDYEKFIKVMSAKLDACNHVIKEDRAKIKSLEQALTNTESLFALAEAQNKRLLSEIVNKLNFALVTGKSL
jgi:hypothetical protein